MSDKVAIKEVNTLLGISNRHWVDINHQSTLNERQYPGYYCSAIRTGNYWEWTISHGAGETESGECATREEAKAQMENFIDKHYPNHVSKLNAG